MKKKFQFSLHFFIGLLGVMIIEYYPQMAKDIGINLLSEIIIKLLAL
jgi:hypothetical protein